MEDNVFNKKEVGDAYNANFIPFRAQIDTGKTDNDYIKSHYGDFKTIAAKYNIMGYPTHLFIRGDGSIVHKAFGALNAKDFIDLSDNALDPDKQLGTLQAKYDSGNHTPGLLFNLATAANIAYEKELAKKITNEYIHTQDNLFTEKNIRFIYTLTNFPEDKGFYLIKNNVKKFDAILGKGSANKKLRSIGIYRIAYPKIYNEQNKLPDFDAIYREIKKYLGQEHGNEIKEYSKVIYFLSFRKYKELEKSFTGYLKNFGTNALTADDLNNIAWSIFEHVNDKALLQKALQWALQSVKIESGAGNNDTVANIYFKLGQKDKAVEYEQKAINIIKQNKGNSAEFEKVLSKFKKM